MKKRLNVVFFGLCFLASLIAEAYCIQALKGEIISTVGIGIVVLITGYLLLDTIRSNLKLNMEKVKFYTDHILQEEIARWNERYTEIVNLQKATYTATKKNTVAITEELKEIISRIEVLEINHLDEFHRIIDLQKKSMEGQKNALNMDIHYNRENTKKIVESIEGVGNIAELKEQFEQIIKLLEANHELLEKGMQPVIIPAPYDTLSEGTREENMNTGSLEDAFDMKGIEAEDINVAGLEEALEIKETEAGELNAADLEGSIELKGTEAEELDDTSVEDAIAELLNYKSDLEKGPVISSFGIDDKKLENPENASEEVSLKEDKITDSPLMKEEPVTEEPPKEESTDNKSVTPLYADPNKSLSPDEIAALFASLGQ